MNKDIIVDARKALQRGERRLDDWYIITSKIDLDVKLETVEERFRWDSSRRVIIENDFFGKVVDVITTSTDRGQHTVINWLSMDELTDQQLNFIQLLLGDDIVRYKINKARLERGVTVEESNILFSKVLERFGGEKESKLKIALENIVGEIK
jgi:hypothetical protein